MCKCVNSGESDRLCWAAARSPLRTCRCVCLSEKGLETETSTVPTFRNRGVCDLGVN